MDGPVAILCGGRGTRLQEQVPDLPKPLVQVGGRPIVWHVIRLFAVQGVREVLLLTGYKGDQVARWAAAEPWPAGVTVSCVDTGLDTPTGGRIGRLAARLGRGPFWAAYADGVADVDLAALAAFHAAHGAPASMTVVRPPLPFGVARLDGDDRVTGFVEKPRSEHWVNGGFFRFEPTVLELLRPDSTLEREPLERLAARGDLRAFRHTGFWDCMDTHKDAIVLNDLWAGGAAPWKLW